MYRFCTLGMCIPVSVGTIVPVLRVMTTTVVVSVVVLRTRTSVNKCLCTSSYYCGVLTGTVRNDIIDVECGSTCKSQVKFCGDTAFVRIVLCMEGLSRTFTNK